MEIKAVIVVMSHLTDALVEVDCSDYRYSEGKQRIRFAKYIIHKLDGNLNQDIDADKMYSDFLDFEGRETGDYYLTPSELNEFMTDEIKQEVINILIREENSSVLYAVKFLKDKVKETGKNVHLIPLKEIVDEMKLSIETK